MVLEEKLHRPSLMPSLSLHSVCLSLSISLSLCPSSYLYLYQSLQYYLMVDFRT